MYVDTNYNAQTAQNQQMKDPSNKSNSPNSKTIFIGNTNLQPDKVLLKRQQAREKMQAIINDANKLRKGIDKDLNKRRMNIENLTSNNAEAEKNIAPYDKEIEELKKMYGITDDSQEQKDFEILVKANRAKYGGDKLTEEESKRYYSMIKEGLTEYQTHAYHMETSGNYFREEISANNKIITAEKNAIYQTNKELAKDHSMVDAQKEAEKVNQAVSKEIVGLLTNEAVEHIDEEAEKDKEEAEKIKEEKEKEEKLLEKAKDNKDEHEKQVENVQESMENIVDLDAIGNDVQNEVQKIMDELKLLLEDIKGSVVDTSL